MTKTCYTAVWTGVDFCECHGVVQAEGDEEIGQRLTEQTELKCKHRRR